MSWLAAQQALHIISTKQTAHERTVHKETQSDVVLNVSNI